MKTKFKKLNQKLEESKDKAGELTEDDRKESSEQFEELENTTCNQNYG